MKQQKFAALVRVTVETVVPIHAETFEQAIAQARLLQEKDIVQFDTDFNDGSTEILGIYKE